MCYVLQMFHAFVTDNDTIQGSFLMTKSNLKIKCGLNRNELGPFVGQIKKLSQSSSYKTSFSLKMNQHNPYSYKKTRFS